MGTVALLGGTLAYLLRAVDQMERRVLGQVAAVFARQVDLARLEERVVAIRPHLERIEHKLDQMLGKV